MTSPQPRSDSLRHSTPHKSPKLCYACDILASISRHQYEESYHIQTWVMNTSGCHSLSMMLTLLHRSPKISTGRIPQRPSHVSTPPCHLWIEKFQRPPALGAASRTRKSQASMVLIVDISKKNVQQTRCEKCLDMLGLYIILFKQNYPVQDL